MAHDLIINDMLETEFGMPPPGGGLRKPERGLCLPRR